MQSLSPDSMALVSRPEFRRLSRSSRSTFNRWLDRGLLPKPVIKDGTVLRWAASDVYAFLRGGDRHGTL